MSLIEEKPKVVGKPTIELVRIDSRPTVEEHIGLAHAVASQYVNNNERDCVRDSEEFAEACLALYRAVEKYDPSIVPIERFGSFAWTAMQNAIRDLHRKRSRMPKTARFDASILENTVESGSDVDPDSAAAFVNLILQDHPDETEEDRKDKALLCRVYLNGEKVADLATEFGVTRPVIYKRINRSMDRIRERHKDEFNDRIAQ